jgi:hypothetical protein
MLQSGGREEVEGRKGGREKGREERWEEGEGGKGGKEAEQEGKFRPSHDKMVGHLPFSL